MLVMLFAASTVSFAALQTDSTDPPYFDSGTNGLWVGYQWLTGINVRTGRPVSEHETEQFLELIKNRGIRYVFVRAGPVLPSGEIAQKPGVFFHQLQERDPETMYLPWVTGDLEQLDLFSPIWRKAFIDQLEQLRHQGARGIHLNIEPISDSEPGYLDLLHEIRLELGSSFFISHATRSAGLWGVSFGELKQYLWSGKFYRSTMTQANQTVVMAYNTRLKQEMAYTAFVEHQTSLLVDWGCGLPGHHILIGVPAYEHAPRYSDPATENIRTASRGIRSALNNAEDDVKCFDGVSVYAHWTTDSTEWADFRTYWTGSRTPQLRGT
jgi:hypothetical protein|tara:strand:+ start:827 stop:1798 length:972 start_codon:yes stop_codon:yes gene_type:complete